MTRLPVLALLAAAALPAAAQTPAKPARLGLCAACHGEDGRARVPETPNLAGQRFDYLLKALRAYKSGQRDVPVMRAALGPLGDAELEQLARWYADLAPCAAGAR
ncbi:cytochrome c553 [Mizugakiibacter sediminis]|uniref:Cytochrome c553 n=1 Tax=Mizugakiibacter sediminis TaxID=1475481 RepID=A0A0K8QQ20_9GAMM|nr:c-type cytochrome [Mizugakiibacter sediminis]GAP66781.1 cytochrome c553 [Mizugakiibacter sediminis]